MAELNEKEFEVNGKKISEKSTIKFTLKTLLWIMGALYAALGYLYFDLRSEFTASNGISVEEKRDFLDSVEEEYDGKFEEMLREIYEMKGDIKVILDRETRKSVQPNPSIQFQPVLPPPTTN